MTEAIRPKLGHLGRQVLGENDKCLLPDPQLWTTKSDSSSSSL